jgi:hypothetical protein
VEERSESGGADSLLEIGVVQHDQCGVPTQLQVSPLEMAAGQLTDCSTGSGRASERDHPDVRIRHQRGTQFRATRQHMENTRRQSG